MDIAWIDVAVTGFAALGAKRGIRKGAGDELVRLARRLVPALFSFGLYGAVAKPVASAVGLKSGAADFWAFVLIFIGIFFLMLKFKATLTTSLKAFGAGLPKSVAAVTGCLRSLSTSTLVLFPLAMAPWARIREGISDYSWFAGFLQRVFGG